VRAILFVAGTIGGEVRAQVMPVEAPALGTPDADRSRVNRLLGIRIPAEPATPSGLSGRLLPSLLRIVTNSDLPYSANDGALWAGRGFNVSVTPAGAATYRDAGVTVTLVVAPSLAYSQNRPFQLFTGRDSSRSAFSSPWHAGATSADLPLRFGDASFETIDFGQSSLRLTTAGWTIGGGVQNEWWGPGIRNTLVMSNNAAGIPHLFLQPSRALRTSVGSFDGRFIVGTLTESRFFDSLGTNDYRSISGAIITYRPAADTGLTLGVSRVVYSPIPNAGGSIGHTLDFLTKWETIAAAGDTLPNGTSRRRSDQIASLFARWEFPGVGIETYGELARLELPRSLNGWLTAPHHTLGYLLGAQLARPMRSAGTFVRAQLELLNLEQSAAFSGRDPPDFYSSHVAVQGYTQRGQIIGASTGPGSSSQWLAGDYFTPRWQAGAFVGRTRWENDALYRLADARLTRHDVTIFSGLRGGVRSRAVDLVGDLTIGRRVNYLFQNAAIVLGDAAESTNVQNITFSLTLVAR
jgi:hypothetical protein